MKKIFASLLLVSAILLAASSNAQNSKSGKVIVVNSSEENLANKTYKFSSLNGVRAGGVFQVEVTRGRSERIQHIRQQKHMVLTHKEPQGPGESCC